MARPPAISMHRARGASVPSRRRRIRRPGRARTSGRAEAGPALSPRPPGGAHCALGPPPPGPRARPQPAARPTARRCKLGPAAPARPPRDARELGESRRARRPGPPRQGVGVPRQARFRFRPGQRSSRRWSQTRRPGTAGHSSLRSGRSIQESRSREKEERRDAGPGKWGLAVRFAGAAPEPSPLRRVAGDGIALLSAVSAPEGGKHLEPRTQTDDPGPLQPRARQPSAGCFRARSSGKGTAVDLRAPGRDRVQGDS
nr:translation initiation factor IF-2-like isoform X5 [Equus asinus]